MAIQVRRGKEADFDANKMLPGEWAVSLDTKYVRMCFAPGIVLRMASYESFESDMELIQGILEECEEIQTAIERIKSEIDEKASLTIEYSNSASLSATRASEEADRAHEEAERAKNYADSAQSATNVQIATKDTAGIIKGGDNHIAEDGTLTLITETTETTMQNSCEGRLRFKEIRGKTEQGENPSPTNPQEIKSVSISVIKTHGKNFVEPILNTMTSYGVTVTNNGDGSFTINGTSTDSVTFRLDQTNSTNDNLKNYKGTYTISVRDKSGNLNPSGITLHLTQDVTYKSYLVSDGAETADIDAQNCFVFIHVKAGLTLNNLVIYPQLEKGMEVTEWEPYCGSSAILSKPIELNKIGDVQDVIVDGKPIRRIGEYTVPSDVTVTIYDDVEGISRFRINASPKQVTNDADLLSEYFSGGYTLQEINDLKLPYQTCIYGKELWFTTQRGEYTTASFKEFIVGKKIYYTLETETTEALPIADQIALNSLETFDGTTYLEFDSPLQPEFVAEYGTSKVGGVALEAKGESQANSVNIEELDAILQDAFIPRDTSQFVSDANTCLKSGIYRTYDDTANVEYANGFLLVFAIDPNMVVQINTLWDPQYISIRTYWWGTWHGWYKIATELDLSALETAMVNNI